MDEWQSRLRWKSTAPAITSQSLLLAIFSHSRERGGVRGVRGAPGRGLGSIGSPRGSHLVVSADRIDPGLVGFAAIAVRDAGPRGRVRGYPLAHRADSAGRTDSLTTCECNKGVST